mgnify:CR=1 FL=1
MGLSDLHLFDLIVFVLLLGSLLLELDEELVLLGSGQF